MHNSIPVFEENSEAGAMYCTYRKNQKKYQCSLNIYFCMWIFAVYGYLKKDFFSNMHFVNLHKIKIKDG